MPPDPPDLSVIAPCFNEEHNVPELARRMLATFDRGRLAGELVLVDDGSRDGTKAAIEALERAHPGRIVGCYHPVNQGITAGWRTGVAAARAPVVAIIDSDLQYQPEDVLRLYRALEEHNVDVVQGWRSPFGRERGGRYTVSRVFNHMLNGAFGMRLKDNKSGFVLCAREVMEDLLTYRGSYSYWQSFIMVAAHAKGYSYKEIETLFENRRQGVSFLTGNTTRVSAKSLVDLGKAVWEYRLRPAAARDQAEQFLRRHPAEDRSTTPPATESPRWRGYIKVFDRTHWMISRDVETRYTSLRRTQWLSPAQVAELQDEKLRRLIRHAYRNVPYYRARMQERGLRPQDLRGVADLGRLPLLGKHDVRDQLYFDILSENHVKDEVLKVTTSGSTGEPFVAYADRKKLELGWAAALRAREWTGYRFGDPVVRLGEALGVPPTRAMRDALDARLTRTRIVPAFDLSDAGIAAITAAIRDTRPAIVDGDAEVLELVARAGDDLAGRVGAVTSGGQTLSATAKKAIETAFGCPVFDRYGLGELGAIAHNCEAQAGLHVVAEGFLVEVIRDGVAAAPGEVGEVVVTDLDNFCLPFVRYRTGDRAVAIDAAEPCPCGRGMPRLGDLQGRPPAIVHGAGGRRVPASFFARLVADYDHAIRKFEVAQLAPDAIAFRIAKAGRFSDDVLAEILAAIRRYLGADTRIEVEELAQPARSASATAAR